MYIFSLENKNGCPIVWTDRSIRLYEDGKVALGHSIAYNNTNKTECVIKRHDSYITARDYIMQYAGDADYWIHLYTLAYGYHNKLDPTITPGLGD